MSEHATNKKSLKRNGSKTKRKATTTNVHKKCSILSTEAATAAAAGSTATRTSKANNYTNTESDESAATIISGHDSNKMAVTQFSVQSSDIDGLRMKISAIRPQNIKNSTTSINQNISTSTSNGEFSLINNNNNTNNSNTSTKSINNHHQVNNKNKKQQIHKNRSIARKNQHLYNNNNNNLNNINNNISSSIATTTTTTTITTTTSTTITTDTLINSTIDTTTTTTAAAITTNHNLSASSSLIVKISKSEELKQQLDQIAKEEAAATATATSAYTRMPDLVALNANTTSYTCPIITITSTANEQKCTTTSSVVPCNSDHTESGCSETTTTTMAGGYAELMPTKKVKVKRKKAHSHEVNKSLKKLRVEKAGVERKVQAVPAFTSDSDDEPLLYRHNQRQKLSTEQRGPRILLSAVNNCKSTNALGPPMVVSKPTLATPLLSMMGSDHIGLSSSDNELPQLVSAAIERVARASESEDDANALTNTHFDDDDNDEQAESHKTYNRSSKRLKNIDSFKDVATSNKRRARPQYQSTLLQDFMEKTQSLGQAATTASTPLNAKPETDTAAIGKKRRGRPKKVQTDCLLTRATTTATTTIAINSTTNAINTNTIESADSGIVSTTSTTQSSTPSPRRHATTTTASSSTAAAAAVNLRRNAASWTSAVAGKARHSKAISSTTLSVAETNTQTDTTTKLDIAYLDKRMYATERVLYPPPRNKRRQHAVVSSPNKEEANIDPVWRKIDVNKKFRRPSLSGYKSDGGGVTGQATICSKVLAAKSGYVSDYGSFHARAHTHAHNSGYKSDASCKSRYSTKSCMSRRSSKKRSRRRSMAILPAKEETKDEEDILQLAGLSLGHSSEESNEYVCKPNLATLPTTSVSKKYGEINRYIVTGEYFGGRGFTSFALKSQADELSLENSAQDLMYQHARKLKSRRSSAASVCSSFYSSTSRVRRRHRHRSSRFAHSSRTSVVDSKLLTEIEILTNNFSNICLTVNGGSNTASTSSVNNRDKLFGGNLLAKGRERRAQKKRKTGEHLDFALLSANVGNLTPSSGMSSSSKRRHKKTSSLSSSPDDHKLPLKKRHYLLSGPGDKCSDAAVAAAAAVAAKLFASNTEAWAAAAAAAKSTASAKATQQFSARTSKTATNAGLTPKKRHLLQSNSSASLEDVALPLRLISPSSKSLFPAYKSVDHASYSKKKQRTEAYSCAPPPGVFEPSVALEIQIPPIAKLGEVAGIITKSEVESPLLLELNKNYTNIGPSTSGITLPKTENVRVVETLLNKTGGNLILKRKRKKINRTGFPTVRRKKRKINEQLLLDVTPDISEQVERLTQQQQQKREQELMQQPKTTTETRQPSISVVSLERLQGVIPPDTSAVVSEQLCSPASSVRSRKMSRKLKEKEKVTRVSQRKIAKSDVGLTDVARIKEEEETNTLSPKLPTTTTHEQLLTTTGAHIKKETAATTTTLSTNKTRTTKTTMSSVSNSNKIKLPSKVKLPAGLDPNINFCCKIRLKRGTMANTATTISANSVHNNSKNNHESDFNENEQIDREAAAKDVEINYLEHDILPENERNFEIDDLTTIQATTTNEAMQLDETSLIDVASRKATNAKCLKKNYLFAGLFSDYYKRSTTTTATSTAVHASNQLLPAPPYCERYLRRIELDFELPYDIWWAYKHAKLPTRITVPSWNYRKIRTNIYAESVRPNTANLDMATCYCKADMACGDNCLNRVVYTECSPSSCPTRDRCRNQKIQKHEVAPGLERFMTENKGWGMRTKLPIEKGTYILEYVGEVVTEREFKSRMATIYLNDIHHYCLHLDGGLVIDGHRMGSDGRFVNHSCQPNCEMQKWSVNGLSRMALFAKRDIEAGEELSYDYNFALFNPAEGQPCRCNAPQCRGVIGGKSQRIKPLPVSDNSKSIDTRNSRARKSKASKKTMFMQFKDVSVALDQKLTEKEKKLVKQQRIFLMRNFEKSRRIAHAQKQLQIETNNNNMNNNKNSLIDESSLQSQQKDTIKRPATPATTVAAQISALSSARNIKTRGLTQAGQDPEVERIAKMALILREICLKLETLKDPNNDKIQLSAIAFNNHTENEACSATKRKKLTQKPAGLDLRVVQTNIEQGYYKQPSEFDEDIQKLFIEAKNSNNNNNNNQEQIKALNIIKAAYEEEKSKYYAQLLELLADEAQLKGFKKETVSETKETELKDVATDNVGTFVAQKLPHMHGSRKALRGQRSGQLSSRNKNQLNEDIIRCICGLFKDEGVMIQCAQCMVWQHTECTRADVHAERYLCERCEPREVDREIPLDDYTEEGHQYYLTLMRGDLHVRQGDAVYVLRDIPMRDAAGNVMPSKKHTYETIGKIDYQECDIFRVERLWKSSDGKRYIFGHHFLRPHETFHEPTRRFYPNEVVRVPLYEVVPIELVIARCWVLDRTTFCKGRPTECVDEAHCYICELRVDKSARFFSKAKVNYPTCTKSFAFRMFPERVKISKTYAPHDVDPALLKTKKQKLEAEQNNTTTKAATLDTVSTSTKMPNADEVTSSGERGKKLSPKKKKRTIKSSNQKSLCLENIVNMIKRKDKQNNQIWLNSQKVTTIRHSDNKISKDKERGHRRIHDKSKKDEVKAANEAVDNANGNRGTRRRAQDKTRAKEQKEKQLKNNEKDENRDKERCKEKEKNRDKMKSKEKENLNKTSANSELKCNATVTKSNKDEIHTKEKSKSSATITTANVKNTTKSTEKQTTKTPSSSSKLAEKTVKAETTTKNGKIVENNVKKDIAISKPDVTPTSATATATKITKDEKQTTTTSNTTITTTTTTSSTSMAKSKLNEEEKPSATTTSDKTMTKTIATTKIVNTKASTNKEIKPTEITTKTPTMSSTKNPETSEPPLNVAAINTQEKTPTTTTSATTTLTTTSEGKTTSSADTKTTTETKITTTTASTTTTKMTAKISVSPKATNSNKTTEK